MAVWTRAGGCAGGAGRRGQGAHDSRIGNSLRAEGSVCVAALESRESGIVAMWQSRCRQDHRHRLEGAVRGAVGAWTGARRMGWATVGRCWRSARMAPTPARMVRSVGCVRHARLDAVGPRRGRPCWGASGIRAGSIKRTWVYPAAEGADEVRGTGDRVSDCADERHAAVGVHVRGHRARYAGRRAVRVCAGCRGRRRSRGIPTCATRTKLNAIYAARQQKAKKARSKRRWMMCMPS